MDWTQSAWPRALALGLGPTLLTGCGSSIPRRHDPLSSNNVNLIFVVSEDLAYNAYALLASYGSSQVAPNWSSPDDYDTDLADKA